MSFVRCLFFIASFSICSFVSADDISEKISNIISAATTSADEILDPEIAFKVSVEQYSPKKLILSWEIEPGYYLYKDKFAVEPTDSTVALGDVVFPSGKQKDDPVFGNVEIYYNNNNTTIPFQLKDASVNEINLQVAYQGCKEDAVCYPPIKKNYSVAITGVVGSASNIQAANRIPLLSEQDSITQKLKDKNLLFNILSFLGFGFLLALTPCVFPMIPILSGIIVGEGERITRTRAISLSFAYVLAMALTYAVLGIIAGMFNLNLQAASQNVWILSLFSMVFVLLALSMFGFYELQLPSSWQSKLSSSQDRAQRGTLKGAAIMGVLSAIIVGPCVAPPLAGALLYISQTGDALLGGFALFAMGLGFGVPLLIVGATSGELLPHAGAWMETIKRVFGVIMLGVAIWFLERVFPETFVLILWATLFITTAIFMGALDRLDVNSKKSQRLSKGLGLVILVYGIILIVAAARGGGTVLMPFKSQNYPVGIAQQELPFRYVSNLDELNDQLKRASEQNKPVMFDFYADWCIVCKEMETYTYSEPAVKSALQQFVLLKADVTENNDQDKALLKHFDLFGPPAILFFNTKATEIKSHRLVGFIKAEPFIEHINQAISL